MYPLHQRETQTGKLTKFTQLGHALEEALIHWTGKKEAVEAPNTKTFIGTQHCIYPWKYKDLRCFLNLFFYLVLS